jgi:dihydrofolate reductase
MITGHVFIATSLDGFIAKPDGDIKWLLERDDPSEDHGYNSFIANVEGIVMGRGTYEKVITMEEWHYSKPVIVLSKTLTKSSVPERLKNKVEILNLSPRELMNHLDKEGWKRVYVDGGQVIQSFLRENLIEDMVITKVPVLIGQGRSLFGNLTKDITLEHLKTISFPSGLVQSHYRLCQK